MFILRDLEMFVENVGFSFNLSDIRIVYDIPK